MRIANIGVAGLVLVLGVTVKAQTTASIAPGTRIRVTAPGMLTPEQQAGRLIVLRPDSLLLQPDGAAEVTIARSAIGEIDTSLGRHSAARRGLLIGLLTGVATGAALGAATWHESTCTSRGLFGDEPPTTFKCGSLFGRGQVAVGTGVLGGLAGLVVGGLIGHAHTIEEWKPVEGFAGSLICFVPNHLAINPVRRGVGLSIGMRM